MKVCLHLPESSRRNYEVCLKMAQDDIGGQLSDIHPARIVLMVFSSVLVSLTVVLNVIYQESKLVS